MPQSTAFPAIRRAVDERRWETARRLCLAALDENPADRDLQLLMHRISRAAGDVAACERILLGITPRSDAERFEVLLLRAGDLQLFAGEQFYRTSNAAHAGLTFDEYRVKVEADRTAALAEAQTLAQSDQREQLAEARTGKPPAPPAVPTRLTTETGRVVGTLKHVDGSPAAPVIVTLGLTGGTTTADPAGTFTFDHAPADDHPFLAVTLDGSRHEIVTRYVAHGVQVVANQVTTINATIRDWESAPSLPTEEPPKQFNRDGRTYRLVAHCYQRNPFDYRFPRQLVAIPVAADGPLWMKSSASQELQPVQVVNGEAVFFDELPPNSEHSIAIYSSGESPARQSMLHVSDGVATIDTGAAQFRIPWEGDGSPPLLGLRGGDNIWRGQGRLVLPAGITVARRQVDVLADGPVLLRVRIDYMFSDGRHYSITFTAHRGEPYLLAHEVSDAVDGARFEFSLGEFGGGRGRGYLHWKASAGSQDWSTLTAADRELARLQESVPWWIPPCGFAYAMTPDGLAEQDFVGVFAIRRGEWIDRKFAAVANGPGDEPAWRRELDWPFPEMVGSTVSMITANTTADGDAAFRFGLFDGERHWGICVSTLGENDGPAKRISEFQHKNSSPTLQQFMDWHLDEPDTVQRPHVVATGERLPGLRAKRLSTAFRKFWDKIPDGGLRFAIEGDPRLGWRMKQELLAAAKQRSRMTLLGRDFGDTYSPVGGRPITKYAEDYDLLAASGVFTAEEERTVRAFLILMGHLFMSPDLMNWKLGSRNANFEADRVDVVGTIGVVFKGHPDSKRFTDHAIELMERSINTHCAPGSGKWYENPACYYLQASKCRMNLLFHLAGAGLFEPTAMPRLRDFLRWGILLLTPPCPSDYGLMRDGCDDAGYRAATSVRRLPPIGDHAHVGPWVPEHYALAAKLYRASDPAFADELLWAYLAGGADGGYFGNLPLLFAQLEEADLTPPSHPTLASRRLEGFGAIFRDRVGQADESYVLIKQGPGGYRYHRTEGSILFFADGKPLIYDGGEAGEAWRHSTLSFHDVHMPLAPGHVERFSSFDAVDFCQGVHPVALQPGQPTFLSDICDLALIDEAMRRYCEPNPVNKRSVWWIKGQYLLLLDELNLDPSVPCHWHLQVVADGHEGDWRSGYRFHGRFGTDLQVLLPGQTFVEETVTQQPTLEHHRAGADSFSMRHLQLREDRATFNAAIPRPLRAGDEMLTASLIPNGIRVIGQSVDDVFFLGDADGFFGRYGCVLKRPGETILNVFDGSSLRTGDATLRCSGASASAHLTPHGGKLTAIGDSEVVLRHGSHELRKTLTGGRLDQSFRTADLS